MKNKIILRGIIGLVFLLGLLLAGFLGSKKLTYLEYDILNDISENAIGLVDSNSNIVQEFYMPYELLHGVAVKIGTYGRDNNSIWQVRVEEADSGECILEEEFNASLIPDNTYYEVKTKSTIKVNKGALYKIHIKPIEVNEDSVIAFWASNQSLIDNANMYVNDIPSEGDLNLSVYGGDTDRWWVGFYILLVLFIIILLSRLLYLHNKKTPVLQDKVFKTLLVMMSVFLLLCTYSIVGTFTDENDNIRSGMIIAKGGVLYKDYITQHTPVVNYLCAVFTLLGAKSVVQFRLLYYVFLSIIWGLIYRRYSKRYSDVKMMALPISIIVFTCVLFAQGYQILADNIQGLCMIVLLLEYLEYREEKTIDWIRSIIVSICVWGSFGSAFVSVYGLAVIITFVLFFEIKEWKKIGLKPVKIWSRYYKLLLSTFTPLICAFVYFGFNHSLKQVFQLTYQFNREVYSRYTAGFGDNIIQPMINGIRSFFITIGDGINTIITARATSNSILSLLILILVICILTNLYRKKQFDLVLLLFLYLCFNGTRDFIGFHSLAVWNVAIFIVVIYFNDLCDNFSGKKIIIVICAIAYILSIYVNNVANNISYKIQPVSMIDYEVVDNTDDYEKIFIDTYINDSIYLLYKNRYPVNRLTYFLPWYLDWYEQDTIDDLLETMPRVAIYFPEATVWDVHTNFSNAFLMEISKYYTRLSYNYEDGWKYFFWLRNDIIVEDIS